MTSPLDSLKTCSDLENLRSTLNDLCAPLGKVDELDIYLVEQAGRHQAMCFWRMQSELENTRIMREWGVGRFGSELVAVVDLEPAPVNAPT